MCGFAGFMGFGRLPSADWPGLLDRMGNTIRHRGPDDCGVWVEKPAGVGLVHRRLSILDLSSAGHQPMVSAGARYVMVFNGEIYNHLELRRELEIGSTRTDTQPHPPSSLVRNWRGHSDTETLLAGVEAWGIEGTLKKTVGMFAIALWDRAERTLCLARDRMGEKPLYYGWQGDTFLFGSELKALKAHPAFRAEINRDAVALQMRHNYIPAPYSIYQGISKLQPGCLLTVSMSRREPCVMPYWSTEQAVADGFSQPFLGSVGEAVDALDKLLKDAVSGQMVADVPLGAFLSGGVDSSAIVALMQAQSDRPVKTFTIGFHEEGYNEAEHAKAVAQHLGTEHTELYVSPKEAMDVIPRLPALYDEPFSDSSQIPTFLVAQMTRQHVTVSLSGDAGDELFGGYNRYFWASELWRKLGRLPTPLRTMLAQSITLLPPTKWNSVFSALGPLMPSRLRYANLGSKMHKLAETLAARRPEEIYHRLISHWEKPTDLVIGATEPSTVLTDDTSWPALVDFEHRMMYLDAITYLPDDILVKVDRAAMGVSLETRVPFLDHRVVEFAWRLPLSMKIRNGQGKWILRQVLYKYIPQDLIERPKMGFGVPIDSWLRGPLRDWAEELLSPSRLLQEGYFNPIPIRTKWEEHQSGQRDWHYYLWDVLMFQAWLGEQRLEDNDCAERSVELGEFSH